MTTAVPVLRDLLAQGDLLLLVHRNGKMLLATPAVHDFLGIAPNANFENVDIFLFVDPTERSESRDNLARVMASNHPIRAIPRTLITGQGLRRKTLGTTMRVDWEGEAALLAVVAVIEDQQALEPQLVENLSPRASQIALLVALGFDVPQMAALLGVKPNTIRTYIKAIYRKTGTHTRVELAHRLLGRQEIQVAEQLIPTTGKGTPALAHVLHPPGPPKHARTQASKPPLTRREAQVASQLAEGFTVANIAARLEISESTVRTHVKSIYRKAGTRSRVDLAWMVPNLNKRSR